jgi:subtilisin-like proprotein convertase family protein
MSDIMDVKTIQMALNVAIAKDIKDAKVTMQIDHKKHATMFSLLSPNLAKLLVAIMQLDMDKRQAEMN